MTELKFLIVGCLHGKKPRISTKAIDAIIAPGDFCYAEIRKYIFKSMRQELKGKKAKEWWQLAGGKKKASSLLKKSFKRGRKVLEYLNSFGVPVIVVPGNWDFAEKDPLSPGLSWKKLKKGLTRIIDCHEKLKDFGSYSVIGHGITSGPEFQGRKRLFNKQFKKMGNLFLKARKPTIFLTHNVPYNTKLDFITDKKSPRYGVHFGSTLARVLAKKFKPIVCIGAHMHEHFTQDKIGKTTCINSGYGPKCNVILKIEGNKISKLKFMPKRYG
ncbi:MAG TPA: metallophosphoesterase [Candidatus Nanoarchaeia archaeon]|nr:metallophosphoesterase [Candidatus Nanoarchaeia archaeon]